MSADGLIEHPAAFALTDPRTRRPLPPVAGSLLHDAEWDPWTVELWLMGTVRWPLSRDLLARGLHTPTGTGAGGAEITPEHGGRVLRLRLPAPAAGPVELRAAGPVVARFLAETWAAVPAGAEPERVDLDALAARLEITR